MRIKTGGIRVSSDEQKKKGQMVNAYKQDILRHGVEEKNIIFELARSGSMHKEKDIDYKLRDGKLIITYDLKKKRPKIYEWLKEKVLKNKVSVHYISKWDRLARNIAIGLGLIQLCKQHDTEIIATNDTNDEKMILFSFVMAQFESDLTKGRMKSNKNAKFELGLYLGTKRLYGYKKTKLLLSGREYLHLVPLDKEKQIILDIFSNMKWSDIKQKHNISPSTRKRIRENKFYCGYINYNNKEKKGIHKPIISEELWKKFNQ